MVALAFQSWNALANTWECPGIPYQFHFRWSRKGGLRTHPGENTSFRCWFVCQPSAQATRPAISLYKFFHYLYICIYIYIDVKVNSNIDI
jgi:hypothetical protein